MTSTSRAITTGDCDKRGYVEVDLIAGGWHRKGRTLDLTP